MSPLIGKMAPVALVAALVAWCCWPHWNGARSDGLGQPPEELPEISDALLSPDVVASSDRDPFEFTAASHADSTETAAAPTAEPAHADPIVEERPSWEQIAERLSRLSVEATCIHGSRRMALIDGQVYEPGDVLTISDAADPCLVTQISAHNVLIRHHGGAVALTYQDPRSRCGPSGPTHTPGQVGRKNRETAGAESGSPSNLNAASDRTRSPEPESREQRDEAHRKPQ